MEPEDMDIEALMDPGSDTLTREQSYSLRNSLRDLLLVLLAALLLAGGSMFFVRASLVRGSSMEPTLLDGDCILVWMAGGQGPERGDLVAIRARDKERLSVRLHHAKFFQLGSVHIRIGKNLFRRKTLQLNLPSSHHPRFNRRGTFRPVFVIQIRKLNPLHIHLQINSV